MKLESKYPGTCKTCGKPYQKGETIEWSRENGTHHTKCLQLSLFPERTEHEANQLADELQFLVKGKTHERIR